MNLNNRTNLFVMSLLLLLLIMSYLTTIYASITTNSNWILILSNPGHDSSEYGDVYYYYEVYKFSGYTQGGYRGWYTVYLRTTDDPVNPQSDDEGFTIEMVLVDLTCEYGTNWRRPHFVMVVNCSWCRYFNAFSDLDNVSFTMFKNIF